MTEIDMSYRQCSQTRGVSNHGDRLGIAGRQLDVAWRDGRQLGIAGRQLDVAWRDGGQLGIVGRQLSIA
ncbi:MAG TPA: hypothetical protein VG275_03200 [Solirubrobacteraceae bacterium]|nr:hypothetical protein [Solirubrobacteraceae bacterium]